MLVLDRDIFAKLERICAEPIARFVVVSGTFVVKHPTCMLRSTGLVNKAAILVLFAVPKSVDAAMLAVLLPECRIDVASGVERSHELAAMTGFPIDFIRLSRAQIGVFSPPGITAPAAARHRDHFRPAATIPAGFIDHAGSYRTDLAKDLAGVGTEYSVGRWTIWSCFAQSSSGSPSQSWWIERLTATMILSGSAVQVKGFGLALCSSRKRLMAAAFCTRRPSRR
jgi:hypothetical protein